MDKLRGGVDKEVKEGGKVVYQQVRDHLWAGVGLGGQGKIANCASSPGSQIKSVSGWIGVCGPC